MELNRFELQIFVSRQKPSWNLFVFRFHSIRYLYLQITVWLISSISSFQLVFFLFLCLRKLLKPNNTCDIFVYSTTKHKNNISIHQKAINVKNAWAWHQHLFVNVYRAIEIDRCSCNDCKCFHFAFFSLKLKIIDFSGCVKNKINLFVFYSLNLFFKKTLTKQQQRWYKMWVNNRKLMLEPFKIKWSHSRATKTIGTFIFSFW